jgi:hypothetical protein
MATVEKKALAKRRGISTKPTMSRMGVFTLFKKKKMMQSAQERQKARVYRQMNKSKLAKRAANYVKKFGKELARRAMLRAMTGTMVNKGVAKRTTGMLAKPMVNRRVAMKVKR